MSKDLNQCNFVVFIGRLGGDVTMKYTASGSAVANLDIACSDDYTEKDTGNKVSRTNWVRVVAFGKLAEIMGEYLKKGSQVFVEGKLTTRKWQDKDGQDRYTTEVVANQMQMLGDKDSRGTSDRAPAASSKPPAQTGQSGFRKPAPEPAAIPEDFQDYPDIPF